MALGLAATTCLALSVLVPISSTVAGAVIFENNGCSTPFPPNGYSQIPMIIGATGAPDPVPLGNQITLGGASLTFAVGNSLIASGIALGVVTAAPDLENLGNLKINNPPDGGTTSDINAGIAHATVGVGNARMKVDGSNTYEATQTLTNTTAPDVTFYVTADVTDGSNVQIYVAVTNPPTPAPPRVTAVPARRRTYRHARSGRRVRADPALSGTSTRARTFRLRARRCGRRLRPAR